MNAITIYPFHAADAHFKPYYSLELHAAFEPADQHLPHPAGKQR
jgi:hypothetical protein